MGTWTTAIRTWAAGETVTAANLNAQLKDFAGGFGAWTSYTPTLSGFTLGNGTIAGAYLQVQKTVVFRAKLTFGSTTTAASAYPTATLPVTALSTDASSVLHARFGDASPGAAYLSYVDLGSTTTIRAGIIGSSGLATTCTTTTPFTWTTSDVVYWAGVYEAA